MPSWFYLSLRSEAGFSQIPTFHFPSPLSVYHALKTRMQTDRHNVRKITLKLSEQIIFKWKNKATKLIYFNRCPSQPAGNKPTGTWVIATCRSVLHEDICHYLYWTQVYINYILAGRQPTVRLPGKHLYNCLIHKDSKKNNRSLQFSFFSPFHTNSPAPCWKSNWKSGCSQEFFAGFIKYWCLT